MEGPITDSAREAMLLAALDRIDARKLKECLQVVSDPRFPISKPVANALAALRKHRDPKSVLDRAQYRAAVPYAAAVYAEPCLAAVIEALGDDADDPTREQLSTALDAVAPDFDDVTLAVMLASVADGDMAASDLCFDVLDTEERFGLTGWRSFERSAPEPAAGRPSAPAASEEQHEARQAKKQRDAEERRRRAEAAARAAEQVRAARKKERAASGDRPATAGATAPPPATVLPSLGHRRALLTPAEEEEFDRADPWATGVVLAWVPFDAADAEHPDLDGKVRPCVVLAGSATHLLVRPGYSAGGVKSRDWKCHPVRHWRRSGFDSPRGSTSTPSGWPARDRSGRLPRAGRLELALVTPGDELTWDFARSVGVRPPDRRTPGGQPATRAIPAAGRVR